MFGNKAIESLLNFNLKTLLIFGKAFLYFSLQFLMKSFVFQHDDKIMYVTIVT